MHDPKFIVTNQQEESISIPRVNIEISTVLKTAHRIMKKIMQRVRLLLENRMSFEQSLELFNHNMILPSPQSFGVVVPSNRVVVPASQGVHSSLPVEFS